MWDNVALLKKITDTLVAFSVLAVSYGVIHYLAHLPGLLPIRSVHLSESPHRVSPGKLIEVIRKETRGNLFTVDIEHLRMSVEKLPWVRAVSIRREFPHGLSVQIEEHEEMARWNSDAMVNRYGEVFYPGDINTTQEIASSAGNGGVHGGDSEQPLPVFAGQDGTSVEMMQQYDQFNRQLAAINLSATQITLSTRHAWKLHLSNGMVLELGREDVQQRLSRFVAAYPYSLARQEDAARYVDLRYRNGFAMGGRVKS